LFGENYKVAVQPRAPAAAEEDESLLLDFLVAVLILLTECSEAFLRINKNHIKYLYIFVQ